MKDTLCTITTDNVYTKCHKDLFGFYQQHNTQRNKKKNYYYDLAIKF